ncbi:GNAT family N-acetyltransferase [Clostridium botulinum]|uniref:Spermidine acetyltransferase n=1 Tax=Clostridium botulinum TaxID=1491 RepID=A0A9Q1ZB14_CLOBO|nr:GNAT family N-acetyltransferase [Clostridium botulinum]AEB74989.1 Spermine/spermidine acetyltransferase [Clostridium botulinum BKT015925]KEI01780.1 spermidine acetyltransferase [Clostridium botulinum C/D str. Sp77]KEI03626.1 spermidine acetyltransferase [Clostridium botulinum D str. 16868]KLU76985.1 spermidine acetyltransferase [Clostridium botulinum V891]KOA73979.1 spermidine acetyltransferase [Clostridium botulinum]
MEYIKEFKEKYLKQCSKIYPSIFNDEPWNENWTETIAHERLREIYNTPKFKGIVYIKDEKVIGAILGNLEQWDSGIKYSLKEFFVDKKAQGNGLGSTMLKYLDKELKNLKIKSVELYTLKGRSTEGFYKKNGYIVDESSIIMNKSYDY